MKVTFTKISRSYARAPERAGAIIEFLILVPLLSLLLGGVYEISRGIHQYHLLNNIAYHSTRAGAQMSPNSLVTGCWSEADMSYKWMSTHPNDAEHEALYLILQRTNYLLDFYASQLSLTCRAGDLCYTGGAPEVTAEIISSSAAGSALCGKGEAAKNTFTVRIRGQYQPALLPMFKIPFSVHSTGYLLANNQTFSTPTNPTEKCVPRVYAASSTTSTTTSTTTTSSLGN